MAEPLLEVEGVTKAFGALLANDGVSLSVAPGELHALIGPNGAGKTTLVSQLAGELAPDSGTIRFAGEALTTLSAPARALRGLSRSFQISSVFPRFTLLQNTLLAVQAKAGHSFRFWGQAGKSAALQAPAIAALERVGLAHRADALAGEISHGERRLLELAMALAGRPRLLLLDEPAAGLGPEETAALAALLREVKRELAILLVEHDMDLVFALADRITVLVYGRVLASDTPDAIRNHAEVREAYLGEPDATGRSDN